jgi:HAD superfamily hydrolase (TIGR01662 family)
MPFFKVIIFDLGSTLLFSKEPWPPIFEQADQALVESLQRAGFSLDAQTFSNEFKTFLDSYYSARGKGFIEKTTFSALSDLLKQKGIREVPPAVVRQALDAMYAVTQKNWYLEADAIPTLEILLQEGYRLGLISNTSDDENVQQLLDREGLRPLFEFIITSAGCGIRKPDKRIFQLAMDHFGTQPEQVVMVGDTLDEDILGANRMGIYSIWISRRAQPPEEGELKIQPQAVISALDQIPGILSEIENGA